MILLVQVHVPLEVAAERDAREGRLGREPAEDAAEHHGDEVLTAVHEGCGDLVDRAAGDVHRLAHEVARGRRGAGAFERGVQGQAPAHGVDRRVDGRAVGAHLVHRGQVEVEVAGVLPRRDLVRLLAEHDAVDEPGGVASRDGSQGISTQVSVRWRVLSRDMKSHTAKTWDVMKTRSDARSLTRS